MMIYIFCYSINYLICNIIVRSVRIESAKFGGGGCRGAQRSSKPRDPAMG